MESSGMARETREFVHDRKEVESALKTARRKYRVIEGFCGPGGMSLGLKRAGFELLSAFDVDPPSVETHNANLGNHAFVADARNVSGAGLLRDHNLKPGNWICLPEGLPVRDFPSRSAAHIWAIPEMI